VIRFVRIGFFICQSLLTRPFGVLLECANILSLDSLAVKELRPSSVLKVEMVRRHRTKEVRYDPLFGANVDSPHEGAETESVEAMKTSCVYRSDLDDERRGLFSCSCCRP